MTLGKFIATLGAIIGTIIAAAFAFFMIVEADSPISHYELVAKWYGKNDDLDRLIDEARADGKITQLEFSSIRHLATKLNKQVILDSLSEQTITPHEVVDSSTN